MFIAIVASFSTASKSYLLPRGNKAQIRADNLLRGGGGGENALKGSLERAVSPRVTLVTLMKYVCMYIKYV